MRPKPWAVSALLSISVLPAGAQTMLGRGSFLEHRIAGQIGPSDNKGASVTPRVVPGTKGPYPTNDWWSSLIYPRDPSFPFGQALFAWPLTFRATGSGWVVGAPDGTPSTGSEFHYGQVDALTVQVEGLAASGVQVVGWTDWTVKARLDDGSRQLDATMGHGLPYAHFSSKGGDAVVSCMVDPTVWGGDGTDAVGITVAGNHYGLFAPPGSSWSRSGKLFRSDLAGKGHWSVAVLPAADAATLARFRRSAFAYPTDTRVSWKVDAASGTVRSDYRIHATALEGLDTTTLMALFPHQWALSGNVNTSWTYTSPRGLMKVVDGSSFATGEVLPVVLPSLPQVPAGDAALLRSELKQAAAGSLLARDADTYWAGKGMWRAASLVPIADQLGETALRDSLLGILKTDLGEWFTATGKSSKLFVYDSAWGSLTGYPASYGSSDELNDHHFHYGYFLMAAATVARFDRDWASDANYGRMVDLLARDAANPRHGDAHLPFLRSFDPYEGHTWASGHASFGSGNNNESSSESINFSVGLAQWGMATGNDSLRDVGLWMAATESRAVEQYWWDVDGNNFPRSFPSRAVGMVWGNGGAHATWFSGEPESIHGINVLPFTPSSLQWTRRADRVKLELAEMLSEKKGGAFTIWKDVMMGYRGIADIDGAWNEFSAWDGQGAEGGTPRAFYRQWLATLREYGNLDTTVRADHVGTAVLKKGAIRTYVAWNPGTQEIVVHFTDGRSLTVPAGKVAQSSGTPTGLAPQRKHLQSDARRIVGAQQLRQMGETSVTAVGLDGGIRFQGKASDAARTIGDRLWILTGQQP